MSKEKQGNKNIRIRVTQDDFDEASISEDPHDMRFCPVAQAIRRRFRGTLGRWDVSVGGGRVEICDMKRKMPKSVAKFIDNFDHGGVPKPFEFEISLSQRVRNRLEAVTKAKRKEAAIRKLQGKE